MSIATVTRATAGHAAAGGHHGYPLAQLQQHHPQLATVTPIAATPSPAGTPPATNERY